METKLSFIIPVYNVENYLNECVDSILSQIENGIEILLIDDGSTDRSGMICDEIAKNNPCVATIHQHNQGHSAARNCGLNRATGKYVAFIDSDDYIGEGSIKHIMEYIEAGGSDICFMNAFKFFPNGTIVNLGDCIERKRLKGKSPIEAMEYLSSRPKYPGSACTKVFRRSFLHDNGIEFPTNLLHSEDLSFCMDALIVAETFDALEVPYYYYRQNRPGSVTSKVDETSFKNMASFVRYYSEKLGRNIELKKKSVETYAMSFVSYEYAILLWAHSRIQHSNLSQIGFFLKDYKWVMKYARAYNTRAISLFCRIFGISFTSMLISIYIKCVRKGR